MPDPVPPHTKYCRVDARRPGSARQLGASESHDAFGPLRTGAVVAAIGGLSLFVSLPPRSWWPFGIVGWGCIAGVTAGRPARRRCQLALIAALCWFVPALWWVADLSLIGWPLLAGLEALIVAGVLMCASSGRGRIVAVPAAAVIAEAIRWRWPLGGFPMASVALGQVNGPFAPVARVGGPLLMIGLVAASGSVLAEIARRPSRAAVVRAILATAAIVGTVLLGAIAPAGAGVGSLRVAAVQGGGPRGTHALESDPRVVFQRQLAASRRVPDGVDVVVWPEDVLEGFAPITKSVEARALGGLAQTLHATVIAGVVEDLAAHRFANAVIAWAPDGRIVGRVDKVHRVPFGEYVPARRFLSHLVDLSRVPRDAVPGHGPEILDVGGIRVGVAISYEVFFPGRARAAARDGAQVLIVPTNATSYRAAAPASEELAAARLRAIETGRAVVQAAPTGYSAIVTADGEVVAGSHLSQATVLVAAVQLRRGSTIYSSIGDAPLLALCSAALIAALWSERIKPTQLGRRDDPSRRRRWSRWLMSPSETTEPGS